MGDKEKGRFNGWVFRVCSSIQLVSYFNNRGFDCWQLDYSDAMWRRPVNRPGINDDRLAAPVHRRHMRVPIAHKPVLAAIDRLAKSPSLVAMQ